MKVGFIGAGNMAHALCRAFISADLMKPTEVLASDVMQRQLESIRKASGVNTTSDNCEVVTKNDVVYLTVKPDTLRGVLKEVTPAATKDKLFVSIAAGILTSTVEKYLPPGSRVVRVMPNTPALVQAAVSVYSRGRWAGADDARLVHQMLASVGLAEELPEELMDAVTGLSGSGPAYCFVAMQAMADGAVKMGLPREQATRYAAQTMLGAAKMVLENNSHPEQLKDAVCSPGGTTIHAVHKLEMGGLRSSLMDAVETATNRSIELGHVYNGKD